MTMEAEAQKINQDTWADSSSPKFRLQFDLYRLRAEEYERGFYSLRRLEWQVAFQIYAGYAVVTAGFFSLKNQGTS